MFFSLTGTMPHICLEGSEAFAVSAWQCISVIWRIWVYVTIGWDPCNLSSWSFERIWEACFLWFFGGMFFVNSSGKAAGGGITIKAGTGNKCGGWVQWKAVKECSGKAHFFQAFWKPSYSDVCMSYNDSQWTAIVGGGHGHYGLCVGGSEPACQAGSATYAGKPSWWWEIYLNVLTVTSRGSVVDPRTQSRWYSFNASNCIAHPIIYMTYSEGFASSKYQLRKLCQCCSSWDTFGHLEGNLLPNLNETWIFYNSYSTLVCLEGIQILPMFALGMTLC